MREPVGLAPVHPGPLRRRRKEAPPKPPMRVWRERSKPVEDSPAWRYPTGERRLHPAILAAADPFDAVRVGPEGGARFAHRDQGGRRTSIEVRGPDRRGSAWCVGVVHGSGV